MATEARPLSSATSQDTLQVASYTPLPVEEDTSVFVEPRPQFLSVQSPSPRSSSFQGSYGQSETGDLLANKEPYGGSPVDGSTPPKPRRRLLIALVALVLVALIVVAVVVPVYFTVIKPKNNTAAASPTGAPQPSSSSTTKHPPTSTSTIFGGDGSTIKASNGSTFTYNNKFGGMCEFCFTI